MMKSRSFANRALEMAMRSMIGATCPAKDRGWDSHNHSLALNLEDMGHSERLQTLTSFICGALNFHLFYNEISRQSKALEHQTSCTFDPITENWN